MSWTTEEAVQLCKLIEGVAPQFGGHVALTGGLLYKDGPRKDCDVLVYRIRQLDEVDFEGLFLVLEPLGIKLVKDHGWCKKLTYNGKKIDMFDPDEEGWEGMKEGTEHPSK